MAEVKAGPIRLFRGSRYDVHSSSTLPRPGSRKQAETAHEILASAIETALALAPDRLVDPRDHAGAHRATGAGIAGLLRLQGSRQATNPSRSARRCCGTR